MTFTIFSGACVIRHCTPRECRLTAVAAASREKIESEEPPPLQQPGCASQRPTAWRFIDPASSWSLCSRSEPAGQRKRSGNTHLILKEQVWFNRRSWNGEDTSSDAHSGRSLLGSHEAAATSCGGGSPTFVLRNPCRPTERTLLFFEELLVQERSSGSQTRSERGGPRRLRRKQAAPRGTDVGGGLASEAAATAR